MKIRVFDPAITEEIADSTPEEITVSSSSGSPSPPNTVPNSTDVSVSDDSSLLNTLNTTAEYSEGGFVVHLQPVEEITNEEEYAEINLENTSEMKTPCNLPSTSAIQQGDRSSVIMAHRLAKSRHTRIYNDATIQHVTRVLFSINEPDNDDLINIENALDSLNIEDKDSTNNPSPAGKQNQKE